LQNRHQILQLLGPKKCQGAWGSLPGTCRASETTGALLAVFGENVTRRTRQLELTKDSFYLILKQDMKRRREAG
jgi:hypothetical protein